MNLKDHIRTIPDFPKPGIMFRDITTLIKHSGAFRESINQLASHYESEDFDLIAGIESRGFIFGAALANVLSKGFVPIRKKGKLPGKTESVTYDLEYGSDQVEVHVDAIQKGSKVLVVDDLIATGGTARAACDLIEKLGGEVAGCAFVIDLPELRGIEKLGKYKIKTLVSFEGH